MSLLSRLRQTTLSGGAGALLRRHLSSSILSPDSKPLLSKEKTRAALTLIKSETNPSKIVEICTAASLTPDTHLDRAALSAAVSKLAATNNLEFVTEFIESLKTRPDLRTERFVSNAMILYGQAKMPSHAVRTFTQCEEDLGVRRSVGLLNSLIFACIVAKDYKQVTRAFVELARVYSIQPDLDTYNLAIQAFSESGSTSSAYSLLADMESKNLKPNKTTFQHLLAGFYAEEKLDDVGKVTNLMRHHRVPHGRSTYNVRIRGLCKLGRSSEAKALLESMASVRIKPNCVSYSHLVHGFCREGDLEEAKRMWKSMGYRGLKPDSGCYFTLVYFLCRGKDFDGALEVAKESIAKNWVPSFSTMKMLVEGLVGAGRVAEVREIVSAVKGKFSGNVDTWNEIEAGLPQT